MLTVAMPRRTALLPVGWVLGSGWLSREARVLELGDDDAAARALAEGSADLALLDPLFWARSRASYRPVPRSAVSLGPGGSDMLLVGRVRLDGLERVASSPLPPRTSEEVVARALVREYLGISEPLVIGEGGAVEGEQGGIVAGVDALTEQPYEYVESASRAWWITSGGPWVRALAVERPDSPPAPDAEALLKDVARLLGEQGESVAAALGREHGGEEARWLELLRALNLAYGAEERKGLSTLLARAARLRLAPRVEDAALPRY